MKVLLLLFLITCVLSIDLTTWELFDQNTVLLTIKDQVMWKLASNVTTLPGGYGPLYWEEGTQQWLPNSGRCVILALSTDQLYCCNSVSNMFRKNKQGNSDLWKQFENCRDVKVGSNNDVWFTTNTAAAGGYTIKTYDITTLTSTIVTGAAVKVAPTPDGKAWIVTDTGDIKQWDGTSWNSRPGSARDIIVGNDGIPFIVSTISRNGAYEIMKWNDTQSQWVTLEGIEGISMALDNRNNPYIIAGNYSVYRPKTDVLLDFCQSK